MQLIFVYKIYVKLKALAKTIQILKNTINLYANEKKINLCHHTMVFCFFFATLI